MRDEDLIKAFSKAKVIAFDMDGTLLDSVYARAESFVRALKKLGVDEKIEEVKKYIGMKSIDIARELIRKHSLRISPEEFARIRTEIFYRELVDYVRPFPCVRETLELLSSKYTLALATSSSRKGVKVLMGDLLRYFEIVITIEDVNRGKPFPDIYMKVRSIDENGIAIEDSCLGIRAAKEADLICIGVLNGNKAKEDLLNAGADYVFEDICSMYDWLRGRI